MPQLSERAAERILEVLPNLDVRLRRESILRVAERVVIQSGTSVDSPVPMVTSLVRVALDLVKQAESLDVELRELRTRYERAPTDKRRAVLVDYLNLSPSSPVERTRDIAAVDQWLDLNALADRFAVRTADLLDDATVSLRAAQGMLRANPDARLPDPGAFSRTLATFSLTTRFDSLREEALHTITALALGLPSTERLMRLGADVLRAVTRITEGHIACDVWSVRAAMTTLVTITPHHGIASIRKWLVPRDTTDDMIRRARAAALLGDLSAPREELGEIAEKLREDESEHVRQQLVRSLSRLQTDAADDMLQALSLDDPSEKVRGLALLQLADKGAVASRPAMMAYRVIERTLPSDSPLLVRCAFYAVERLLDAPGLPRLELAHALARLVKERRPSVALALRAALLVRRLALSETPRLSRLSTKIADQALMQPEGVWKKLEVLPEYSLDEVLDCALVAGWGGLGLALEPRRGGHYSLLRGERKKVRLWRILHELRHPAPDKRQGYPHLQAPATAALAVIPPELMGEVTQTSVPGERLVGPQGEWGIFLPRVETVLATADRGGRVLRMITAFGTLEIRLEGSLWRRVVTRLRLAWSYAKLAAIRETSLRATGKDKRAYIQRLTRLGFRFAWTRTSCTIEGQQVQFSLSWVLDHFALDHRETEQRVVEAPGPEQEPEQ